MHSNMTLYNTSQSRLSFEQKLLESGVKHIPLFQIKPNTFQRFSKDKKYSILYDGKFGFFRDWSGEFDDIYWFSDPKKDSITSEEIKKLNQQIEAERKAREEIIRIRNEKAAKVAKITWERLANSGESEYLKKKQLSPINGIKFGKNRHGNFIATVLIDNDGKIWARQFIYDKIPLGREKNKEFLIGAKKKGNYTPLGNLEGDVIYICEGVATGLSIAMAMPKSLVIIAYDCHNLESVTNNILEKYSGKEIIIAADNDSSKDRNIGIEKADAVAKKFDLKLIYPKFKNSSKNGSDFNDLHCSEGINEVTNQLNDADYLDPEPLLFSSLSYPEIEFDPEDVLGKNILTKMAKQISASTETPVEYSIGALLGAAAACLQNKFLVRINKDRKEPLVLQIISTGRSGDGKSPVFNHAIKPILNLEHEKMPLYRDSVREVQNHNKILDSKISALLKPKNGSNTNSKEIDFETLKKKVNNLEAQRYPDPIRPEIIAQDITPEQIAIQVRDRGGKIAIMDHEGGVLNTIAGRYNSGMANLDILLKGYDGDGYKVNRFNRDIEIPAVYASVCLFIQPGILSDTKNIKNFIESGFFGRSLFFNPKPKVGYRKFNGAEVDSECKSRYEEMIRGFFELRSPDFKESFPEELKLGDEAYSIFRNYELEIEPCRRAGERYAEGGIGSWIEKSKKNAVRIAGILHLIENPRSLVISKSEMERAINFIKIMTQHAISIFDYIGNTPEVIDAIKLWEFIQLKKERRFNYSDLKQRKKQDSRFKNKPEVFDNAVLELEKRDIIIRIGSDIEHVTDGRKKRSGRPLSSDYRVNYKISL